MPHNRKSESYTASPFSATFRTKATYSLQTELLNKMFGSTVGELYQ